MQTIYKNRRNKLFKQVDDEAIIILASGKSKHRSADYYYDFVVNKNFYYYTGLEEENLLLAMVKKGDKYETILFIEPSNPKLEKWVGPNISKKEAERLSGISHIKYTNEYKSFVNETITYKNISSVYLDIERPEYGFSDMISHSIAREIKENFLEVQIKNVHNKLTKSRMTKDYKEINKIKEAIGITKVGIERIMKECQAEMMEYQLAAHFEFECKNKGARQLSFNTIAASGKNATTLHYEKNESKVKDGDLILFDLGAEFENYCADISRTFPVNGKFTERQKQIYDIVLKANEKVIKKAKPGMKFKELNEIAKKVLVEECLKINLIKDKKDISKYYYHGVSHSLGLDTHDVFNYDSKLEVGMVLTVEPGLYIEEEGIGIRIEDDILISQKGAINLSKDIIKTTEEIEKFMAQ